MFKKNLIVFLFGILIFPINFQAQTRWVINSNAGITWNATEKLPHNDHIEMSGKQVSVVLRYGVTSTGAFTLNKSMVWPLLRTIPNNTHASLMRRSDWNPLSIITVNGRSFSAEKVNEITLNGTLTVQSSFAMDGTANLQVIREYIPSVDQPALIENYTIINKTKKQVSIEIPAVRFVVNTDKTKGVDGSYRIETSIDTEGSFILKANDTLFFTSTIAAYKLNQPTIAFNGNSEKKKRVDLVSQWMNNLVLETPNDVIDRMFAFSKIRAAESIFETKGGPMHGPGGESYYAAIWANDQAEYINPYFPFLGYEYGNASALNAYNHFARFMNNEWKAIPSSIIAEGLDIWNGAGDRGDAAMIAYGAARYALARSNKDEALKLWPLIEWCLQFSERKLNKEGVVKSDADELEGRFPSGEANLCTSSLHYDALISAAYLCKDIGMGAKSAGYFKRAATLRNAIEKYFGAEVEGFKTYAYYKGNNVLRSWICMPLTVGIDERATATLDALFSPRLWTTNGLLTQAGSETFWDRSTLYALRGAYAVGETKRATEFLDYYSKMRLLGNHVPYAIEAWPEGSQRHLSAESALYGRIITEGMFGIRPTGLKTFTITPRLPKDWNFMNLRKIHAFGACFDLEVKRMDDQRIQVKLIQSNNSKIFKIKDGNSLKINVK